MKVGNCHLSYCTNIHPGESLSEVRDSLERHLLEVRKLLGVGGPFGIGLRLSALAAKELAQAARLEEFVSFLRDNALYVFSINGFPYGPFHREPVKQAVYEPDWTQVERSAYTQELIELLSHLLPQGITGSISTVPLGYAPKFVERASIDQAVHQLLQQVQWLAKLHEQRGQELVLALEPEPCCFLETTADAVHFFETELLSQEALVKLAGWLGTTSERAERAVRRHLGLCLDTCHAAVEFERAQDTLRQVTSAGLRVAKLQASTGLKLNPRSKSQLEALRAYDEPVYLHQVVAERADKTLLRYLDLSDALQSPAALTAHEWRVHFHVPLYQEQLEAFSNTQHYLSEILALQKAEPFTDHIEVETYTWDVLPLAQRTLGLHASIARELRWVRERL